MKSRPKRYSASRISAYVPGEDYLERHARRRRLAEAEADKVALWCDVRGIAFRILGSDDHPHCTLWVFKIQLQRAAAMAKWNPATGRAERIAYFTGRRTVVGRKKDKIYDWEQLLLFLEDWFNESKGSP